MGILNRFGKNKSGSNISEGQDTMHVMEEGVDPKNYDISDEEFKEGISQYYQAAENYLNEEKSSPKIAAASMKLLDIHLKDSYLVKGTYQSNEAKNQITNFSQSIRQHCERMFSKLSQSENAEVNKVVSVSKQLIDETYYVDNYEIANDLREANVRVTELKSRNSLGISIVQIGVFILFLVCVLNLVLAPMEDESGIIKIASIAGSVIFIAVFIASLIWQKKLSYGKSSRIIRKYGDILDFERFNQLDQLFDGNYEQAALLKEQHQKLVDQFFYQSAQGGGVSQQTDVDFSGQAPQEEIPLPQPPRQVHQSTDHRQETTADSSETIGEDITSIFGGMDIEGLSVGESRQDTSTAPVEQEFEQPAADNSPQKSTETPVGKVQADRKPPVQPVDKEEEKVVIAYCMMCGTKVKENAVFCPNCGSRLEL